MDDVIGGARDKYLVEDVVRGEESEQEFHLEDAVFCIGIRH